MHNMGILFYSRRFLYLYLRILKATIVDNEICEKTPHYHFVFRDDLACFRSRDSVS
jgi:hypothetical protein